MDEEVPVGEAVPVREAVPVGEAEVEETGSAIPGLIRRARRIADVSQRGLAARLGVSQSTVARWESGEVSPSWTVVERILATAGLRVAVLDEQSVPVTPMSEHRIRDRAGRRLPAHVDPWAMDWYVPDGLHLTARWDAARRRSAVLGIAQVRYHRGLWRSLRRAVDGQPDDHPTREEVLAHLAETSPVRTETSPVRTETSPVRTRRPTSLTA